LFDDGTQARIIGQARADDGGVQLAVVEAVEQRLVALRALD